MRFEGEEVVVKLIGVLGKPGLAIMPRQATPGGAEQIGELTFEAVEGGALSLYVSRFESSLTRLAPVFVEGGNATVRETHRDGST